MTCIVGVVGDNRRVLIGGDSAGIAGWSLTPRADEKVFRAGEFVFGFTDSFRMGQLLRYKLDLDTPERREALDRHCDDLDRYMATSFVDAVRQCLEKGGYAEKDKGVEKGGVFLVGLRGRLYRVGSDFQVGRSRYPFEAVGCANAEARGALYALYPEPGPDPKGAVLGALTAAAALNGGAHPPFEVVST